METKAKAATKKSNTSKRKDIITITITIIKRITNPIDQFGSLWALRPILLTVVKEETLTIHLFKWQRNKEIQISIVDNLFFISNIYERNPMKSLYCYSTINISAKKLKMSQWTYPIKQGKRAKKAQYVGSIIHFSIQKESNCL